MDDFRALLARVNTQGEALLKELETLRADNASLGERAEHLETQLQDRQAAFDTLQAEHETLSQKHEEQRLENERLKAQLKNVPKRRLSATFDYPIDTPPETDGSEPAVPSIEPHSPVPHGPRVEVPHWTVLQTGDAGYVAPDDPDLTPIDNKICGNGWERDNGALLRQNINKQRPSNKMPESLRAHDWSLTLISWPQCEHDGDDPAQYTCLCCIRRKDGTQAAEEAMRAADPSFLQIDNTAGARDSVTDVPTSPRDYSNDRESRLIIDGQEYSSRTPRKPQDEPTFTDPFRSPAGEALPSGQRTFSLNEDMPKIGTNVRGRFFNPTDPRRDGLQHTSLRDLEQRNQSFIPADPRHRDYGDPKQRKSICTECWENSERCDFYGECGPCRIAGKKCIRKICCYGPDCEVRTCPRLHRGQWDENDSAWTVEEGHLPKKAPRDPRITQTTLPAKRALSPSSQDHPQQERSHPCCQRCWKTDNWCTGGPRCQVCRTDRKGRCVYYRCRFGLSCRSARCVYIHPGQWDEGESWNVEDGDLGTKNEWARGRGTGRARDTYRPGQN